MRLLFSLALAFAATLAAAETGAQPGPIQFEDVTAKSGIQFTHSFGAEKSGFAARKHRRRMRLVRLQQRRPAGPVCDVSGRPLEKGMHPYPLRKPPAEPPHNHLYRNDGNGKFTDVTEQAGVGGDGFSFAAIAADFDNDGCTDLLVTSYGHVTLYRNKGDGTFEDVTEKAGLKFEGWAHRRGVARLRPRRLR